MSILKVTQWHGAHAPMPGGGTDPAAYLSVISDGSKFRGLDKTAGADRFTRFTQGFIENELPSMFREGNVYILDAAMGAGEAWSSNINADWFGEDMLKAKCPTFVTKAHPFFHHQNKDPRKAKGQILYATYNPVMRRVELVVELSRSLGGDVVSAIDKGEYPRTSMGFRAEWDQCSICGNVARSRSQYCDHLRLEPNKIYHDGRKVYAINTEGYFFDHSYVIVPADKTAGTMVIIKVADNDPLTKQDVLGAEVAEQIGMQDPGPRMVKAASVSDRDSDARQAASVLAGSVFPAMRNRLPGLTPPLLAKMASMPLSHGLATLAAAGVFVRPADFQFMALCSNGFVKTAIELRNSGRCFDPTGATDERPPMDLSDAPVSVPFVKMAAREMAHRTMHAWHVPAWIRMGPNNSRFNKHASPGLARAYRAYAAGWPDSARALGMSQGGRNAWLESIRAEAQPSTSLENVTGSLRGLSSLFAKHGACGLPATDELVLDLKWNDPLIDGLINKNGRMLKTAGVNVRTFWHDLGTVSTLSLDIIDRAVVESVLEC